MDTLGPQIALLRLRWVRNISVNIHGFDTVYLQRAIAMLWTILAWDDTSLLLKSMRETYSVARLFHNGKAHWSFFPPALQLLLPRTVLPRLNLPKHQTKLKYWVENSLFICFLSCIARVLLLLWCLDLWIVGFWLGPLTMKEAEAESKNNEH